MGLPVTRIINVSLTKVPQGLAEYAVNTIALFTNDTPSFGDIYRTYTDALSVETDFGSDSLTAQMAQNIFAQSPNILSGNGSLVVIPLLSSVSATSGSFETADISANIDNFKAVSNGEFKITLNGIAQNIVGLDFTNCQNLADIASVIKGKLHDVLISAEVNSTSGEEKLVFESKKFGTSSSIAFSAVSGGTGTSLIGSSYLNTAAGTASSGTASSGETIVQAITRTMNKVFYVGILDTLYTEDAVVKTTASSVQSKDMIYLTATATTEDIAGLATDISDANQDKTRVIMYTNSVRDSKLALAAYAGRAFSVDFSASNSTSTMNLKDLVNITPDEVFESTDAVTIANNCETAGVDYYTSFSGVTSAVSTGGNDYLDNVYNDVWFKFALEVAGFNYLKETGTKIIQTEAGMDGLKGAYNKVCQQGVTNQAFAPGQWNSSQTFGNPETFKQNVAQVGYYTYSLPIALQSQAERNQRKAPACQIAAKRAGAIHSSDVLVVIEN